MNVGRLPTPAGSIGIAVLAFALAASCRPAPVVEARVEDVRVRPIVVDRTIHGDTRFYREERFLAEYACEAWQRFSAGRVRFAIVWDYDEAHFVELAELPHIVRTPQYLAPQRGRERVGGWVDGNEIHVVPDNCPELYPCVLHELGHFAGLEDLGEPGAIMSRRYTGWKFNEADRAECIRVGRCEAP